MLWLSKRKLKSWAFTLSYIYILLLIRCKPLLYLRLLEGANKTFPIHSNNFSILIRIPWPPAVRFRVSFLHVEILYTRYLPMG